MKRDPKKTLRNKCDKLYQEVCLKLHPTSMASGLKSEVTHHHIPKSLSNALRYDVENGITLTKSEHFRHGLGDPAICEQYTSKKSAEWFAYIKEKRRETVSPTLSWYKKKYETLKMSKLR